MLRMRHAAAWGTSSLVIARSLMPVAVLRTRVCRHERAAWRHDRALIGGHLHFGVHPQAREHASVLLDVKVRMT